MDLPGKVEFVKEWSAQKINRKIFMLKTWAAEVEFYPILNPSEVLMKSFDVLKTTWELSISLIRVFLSKQVGKRESQKKSQNRALVVPDLKNNHLFASILSEYRLLSLESSLWLGCTVWRTVTRVSQSNWWNQSRLEQSNNSCTWKSSLMCLVRNYCLKWMWERSFAYQPTL